MKRLHAAHGSTYFLDDAGRLVRVLDALEPARLLELETELRTTRDLRIPGIRRAIERTEHLGRPALVSTFFAGEPIAQPPSIERFLELAIRIAEAIGQLHAQRIVHGHLSPDAIRVDAAYRDVEISELGHASRIDVELEGTATFAVDERARYASPEQTGRMNRPVDWRTDLYSLGAIFFEMLTGRAAFTATDRLELVHQLIAVEPPRVHALAPHVPEMISAIVAMLLAKNAEDRYQSGEGLRADLSRCLDAIRSGSSIAPFALGKSDTATRLTLARRLYGRDLELASLLGAADRTAAGATELVLVAGPAGVGKTALVHEVQRPLASRRGRFIEGKFDQYQQDVPFSAFSRAFDRWVHLVLAESEDELAAQRDRIREAVGDLGGLVTGLVPDLELVIGPQPAPPEIGPSEALHRFQYVLRRFLRAIADVRRPLVVFVDDLQWADPASLQLLGTLVSSRETTHLLIVGAYRDNEVAPGHPFQVVLDALLRSEAPVSSIALAPLSADAIEHLIADAVGGDRADVRPLARFVGHQTGGNALFVRQLLRAMEDEQLLRYLPSAQRWEWDLRAPGTGQSSEMRDVLDLIVARARRLPDTARDMLVRAACLGSRFDGRTLASIVERGLGAVASELSIAIREGLLVAAGLGHRYVEAGLQIADDVEVAYVFPHDRIQQAVYSLVSEDDRADLHLSIGRRLRAQPARARVFDVAHQLNAGRRSMRDPSERRALAELNLEAALTAKRAAAYASALGHLAIAIELLAEAGGDAWSRDHALALALHTEAAECAYLSAQLDAMERHTEEVLAHGRSILETIRVRHLRVDAWTSQNRLQDALKSGREALAQLGERFPADPKMHHILLGLARTKLILARKDVPALARQKRMTDPHKLEAMLLLERMVPPAYMSGSPLFPLLVFAMVDLSVKYGNSPLSPFGYGSFAITLSGVLGDIRSGEVFGRTALDALRELGAEQFEAKVLFVLYVFIEHWTKHLRSCEAPLLDAYHSGMKAGNLVGATWSAYYRLLWMFFRGAALPELEREAATYSAIFDQLKQNAAHRRCDMLRQVMLNLLGRTGDPVTLSGEAYDDAEVATLAEKGDDATSRFFYHYVKGQLSYLFGRPEDAITHGDSAKKLLEAATGLPDTPFWCFWDGLARARVARSADGRRKRALLGEARAHLAKLAKWGGFGPANYQHKHDLLAAEIARASGDGLRARDLYDRAIDGATRSEYVQEAALASELAALFHLDEGRRELGGWYLRAAHEGYLRWGATAKVDALEAEHPSILIEASAADAAATQPVAIDLASVVKATTAISAEIVLDRLSATLLEILAENAGAERGALVLYDEGKGTVVAHKPGAREPVVSGLEIPIGASAPVPEPVLAYVARTKRSLVVEDAIAEPRFARDTHVVAHRVRSILCAPIVHHGELRAAVYLENNLAPGAFTSERIALTHLLGGQIAISLENAKLVRHLTSSLDKQKELTSAYSRFTPRAFLDHLGKESILDVRLGDHRHGDMTVVFLDIRAYTTLSESMSEGDNFAFINGFLSRMTPAIAQHHGVVSEFMGDGIMSFFPRRPEDAIDACIEMQRAVRAYNVERRAKGRRDIAVGMGVHTGPLMIGIIGDRDRMGTALVSDTVNTAARMEGLTKEFQVSILASERTVSRLPERGERYGFRHVGDVRVKGKTEVLRVYECTSGEADEAAQSKRATRASFVRGLERWRSADFRGAADAFEDVLRDHAGDGTARRYLERSIELLAYGSPSDWTGIETIDRK